MVAAESDQSQIAQDENEQIVEYVHKDKVFTSDKTRESVETNVLKQHITKQCMMEGVLMEHGQERTLKHLEIEECVDRIDVKKRQKREVSESEHFDESEIVKMARHVFRSHPINRLQQAQVELNNYEMEGDKLAYNLDAHSLKNDYEAIEYDTNENDHIDIIKSIFCKENVKSIDSENVANIYGRDYIDLPKTGRKKSENSITFVSNSTIAFEPKSKCYLNPKQIDNYQHRHDIETSDKVKSKKSDNLELDVDNKRISNMRKDQEEKDCDIEDNLFSEDTSKMLCIYI